MITKINADAQIRGTLSGTTISSNTTITYSTYVEAGNPIVVAAGTTLTINGPFSAGIYQVFDISSGGTVIFGEGACLEVIPEWWYSGTGDFAPAINAAIKSITLTGGQITFTKSHNCTTSINATRISYSSANGNNKGITFQGRFASDASVDYGVTIAFAHTGVGFDCSGSEHFTFRDMKFKGGALSENPVTTIPTVGILLAREALAGGCGKHNFENVIFDYVSKFSVAPLYNYGSEENTFYNCRFANSVNDKRLVAITCSNAFSVASSIVTLATGNQSTTVHSFINCAFANHATGGTTTNCVFLDGVSDIQFIGGFLLNPAGQYLFYVQTDNAATSYVTITGMRDELGSVNTIFINAGANRPTYWSVYANHFQPSAFAVFVADGVNFFNLNYWGNSDGDGVGISAQYLDHCRLDMLTAAFVGRAGGNILQCEITDNFAAMTFSGSKTLTRINDEQYGSVTVSSNSAAVTPPVAVLTLTANSATTVKTGCTYIKATSIVLLTPASATAAADQGSATGVYVLAANIVAGTSFTISHPNNANADKAFNYSIINI